jgi:hypothetical protein
MHVGNENCMQYFVRKLQRSDHLGDLGIDRSIILKSISKNRVGRHGLVQERDQW